LKHLVIFVKAPEAGRVKTRLARDIGNHPAAQVYRRMSEDIIRRLTNDARWKSWLAVSPDLSIVPSKPKSSWSGLSLPSISPSPAKLADCSVLRYSRHQLRRSTMDGRDKPGHDDFGWKNVGRSQSALGLIPQGQGDLGARMNRVFQQIPPGPVLIVGSDCPAMTRDHIFTAFRALGSHDAVVGPAEDGGYWLIGVKRTPRIPRLFEGVRWSSPNALSDTLLSLPRSWRVAALPMLRDIDTLEDLRATSATAPSAAA
jgi:glycosyltransferase A (GT-A) superfamily protein (DUF2064 family)